MVPKFLGLAQFKGNCKMPDPQNLVHLCRGLLVKLIYYVGGRWSITNKSNVIIECFIT